MNKLIDLVKYLNDPHLVAKIQESFGLNLIGVITETENSNDSDLVKKNKNIKSVNYLNNQKCLYLVQNSFFYWFFLFVTKMGNEIFYILFLPILSWMYDDRTMFCTCMAWAFTMYIGQAIKDILKIPRPRTPPVVKIEDKYLLEYGFPSTHAMAALTISFTLLTFVFETQENFNFRLVLFLIAFLAVFFVCLSRIYLGMHSFLDIFGGLSFALTISLIFIRFSGFIFYFVQSGFLNGVLFALFFLAICFIYPNKTRWSPARADTFLIMGAAAGLVLAMTVKYNLGIKQIGKIKSKRTEEDFSMLSLSILRILIGVVWICLVRFLSKEFYYFLMRKCFNLKNYTTAKVKEFIISSYKLEIGYYFCCYSNVSFAALCTCFILFHIFGTI